MNLFHSLFSYHSCQLCPRMCKVNRLHSTGFCGCGSAPRAARAALHKWEEPCISGPENSQGGSGTIFFSGCTLSCCFCQNYKISRESFGMELSETHLSEIFLRLQEQGAYNLNLVTPTQYLPSILKALDRVRHKLTIPVVYNCGGYERFEVVKALNDYVDIWLPDFKYYDNHLARRYSETDHYFEAASLAILQMIEQTGPPVFESQTLSQNQEAFLLMKRGVIVRHMILPGCRRDSIHLLHWIRENLPKDHFLLSLMSQYTPYIPMPEHPELNRRLTSFEYDSVVKEALLLGLSHGYRQLKSSADQEYTPPFQLEGLQ